MSVRNPCVGPDRYCCIYARGDLPDDGRQSGSATRHRLPPPEQPESSSMPSNERFRLHDGQESTPVDEARQRNERNSGRVISSPRLDLPLEVRRQLLAKEQILGGEFCM